MRFEELYNNILESPAAGGDYRFWGDQGAGTVVYCEKTNRFLIGLRSQYVNEPNTWGTIGGKIDDDEDPREAAIRELREETGYEGEIEITPIDVFQSGNFKYHNFLGKVPEEFDPELNWETSEFEWRTLNDFPDNLHFGLKRLLPKLRRITLEFVNFETEINNILTEDPDSVYGIDPRTGENIYLDYEVFDAFPFVILKPEPNYVIYSKKPGIAHFSIKSGMVYGEPKNVGIYPSMDATTYHDLVSYVNDSRIQMFSDIVIINGRFWKDTKVIAFWEDHTEVMKYIHLIFKFMESIDEDPEEYIYQFATSDELIPYHKIFGDIEQNVSDDEIRNKREQHMLSPLLKRGNKVIDGFGSTKALSVPDHPGKKWWAINSESYNEAIDKIEKLFDKKHKEERERRNKKRKPQVKIGKSPAIRGGFLGSKESGSMSVPLGVEI